MDGDNMTVHILRMPELFAIHQVCTNYCCKDTYYCDFYLDVSCNDGDIRLADGSSSNEGRVEVCHNNIWGTVCDDSWSRSDGIVACHQLGLEFVAVTTRASFGTGTGPIWLDNLRCTGSESRLVDCDRNSFGSHDCSHYEDAGVVCGCK